MVCVHMYEYTRYVLNGDYYNIKNLTLVIKGLWILCKKGVHMQVPRYSWCADVSLEECRGVIWRVHVVAVQLRLATW